MKLLVDMNLSPAWCLTLREHGFEAEHWSHVGDPRAADTVIMQWAREHGCIVFTHDLDFTTLLATTNADGPSVVQIRTPRVVPEESAALLVRVLRTHSESLERGALITIDAAGERVRILPLR
jgi:predicted nuclease of predicted toxin-antitoxin system